MISHWVCAFWQETDTLWSSGSYTLAVCIIMRGLCHQKSLPSNRRPRGGNSHQGSQTKCSWGRSRQGSAGDSVRGWAVSLVGATYTLGYFGWFVLETKSCTWKECWRAGEPVESNTYVLLCTGSPCHIFRENLQSKVVRPQSHLALSCLRLMSWQGKGKKVVGKTMGGHYTAGDKMAPEEELTVEEEGGDRPAEITNIFFDTNFMTQHLHLFLWYQVKCDLKKKTSEWVDEHINSISLCVHQLIHFKKKS